MRELPPRGWGGKHLGENCETRAETPPPTGSGKDQESGIPVKEQPWSDGFSACSAEQRLTRLDPLGRSTDRA